MNETSETDKRFETLYSILMDKPNRILNIFNDFFGESRVDMQGYLNMNDFMTEFKHVSLTSLIGLEEVRKYHKSMDSETVNPEFRELSEEDCNKVFAILANNMNAPIYRRWDNMFILVHFPHVRVTNEYNKYVDINHLYAKIPIDSTGIMAGRFSLNRSEYPTSHIISGYMHSHVACIPTDNFSRFQTPCTGTGPINSTMVSLNVEFDPDLWTLFCLELDKYVRVESIAGVPYHRLESIGASRKANTVLSPVFGYEPYRIKEKFKDFIKYLIDQNKLRFNYVNGNYTLGMSNEEYILTVSNVFTEWYNKMYNEGVFTYSYGNLLSFDILKKCIFANGTFFKLGTERTSNYKRYEGKSVCMFKGKKVTVHIIEDTPDIEDNNSVLIINNKMASYILTIILYVINYKYGRTEQNSNKSNGTGQETRYI